MNGERAWERVALAAILCLELWVFSGTFQKFFNLDSLFYIVEYPRSAQEFVHLLANPDEARQYRPLTLGLMGIVVPLLGNDPHPHHWIPLLFHLANTLLFYRLARRLIPGSLAAMSATAIWGLHSVAGWVIYDISYVSDFLSAFLLLTSLLLAISGADRGSHPRTACSLILFCLALLTKEAAVTFPLALWIALGLAGLRASTTPLSAMDLWKVSRKHLPLVGAALTISIGFAGLLVYWLRTGVLYAQGAGSAYDINLFENLWSKSKYLFWALNLPDTLHVASPGKTRALIFILMGIFLLTCAIDIIRRRCRLSAVEWGGLIWFVGLSLPALMLSHRLAKWYLYTPLLGLSLTMGVLVQNSQNWLFRRKKHIAPMIPILFAGVPLLFSTLFQTRSHFVASEPSYVSNVLRAFIDSFRTAYPSLPAQTTLFVLPSFDEAALLLSAPPINHGELFKVYYPEAKIRAVFADRGERLSLEELRNPSTRVLQYLDGLIHDVTPYFRDLGKMTLHVLPTFEGKAPPLLRRRAVAGNGIYGQFVELSIANDGARLPENYFGRSDIWILQYINGHFIDVTDYYKGRRLSNARRVVTKLEDLRFSVNRNEFYPDYARFGTPNGTPVFFATPDHGILTQIGGSTVTIPFGIIPPDSVLRFDVSWMYDSGDGAWGEMLLRTDGREDVLFREYMDPSRGGKALRWKEVSVNLAQYESRRADLILKCTNEPGRNTVSDWLNWRDIAVDESGGNKPGRPASLPPPPDTPEPRDSRSPAN